jgi:hypothetical protein
MSFIQRLINLEFALINGATLDGKNNSVTLSGHRCEAIISNPGGDNMTGTLQLRVFGMKLSDMNALSAVGTNGVGFQQNGVTVCAGNAGATIPQIFQGNMLSSYIDFAGSPEVSFNVVAQAGVYFKAAPAAPNSYGGAASVASIIESLAKSIGFGFQNNGVTSTIVNQYLGGSIIDQIRMVAYAASIPCCIENGVVAIWPNNGLRDDVQISIGPGFGLVGYPTYTEVGFKVKSDFNTNITIGRTINLTSVIPKANGAWISCAVSHEISTMSPDGPWFTTADLIQKPGQYVSTN